MKKPHTNKIRVIVQYSGGKDSQASLLHSISLYGIQNVETVFCDTGWESPLTLKHIADQQEIIGQKHTTIHSKKYAGMLDLAHKKKRFPSSRAKFCTEELKVKPFIDFLLDEVNEHTLIIQGIRAAESKSRGSMSQDCQYFKYYFQPYGYRKDGRPKQHTYRKKEIIKYLRYRSVEIFRPLFNWSADQVIECILLHGLKPNPLYYLGSKRVGCYPCIFSTQPELASMLKYNPDRFTELHDIEQSLNSTFFAPDRVPARYKTAAGTLPIKNIVKYLQDKSATGDLFQDSDAAQTCASYYHLCE